MNDEGFSTTITVDRTPDEVFAAVNDVRGWWTGQIDGVTDVEGAEFTYQYGDIHRSVQRVTELLPARRVVWRVTDSHLSFAADPTEWTGTDIVFDIAPLGDQTEVRFTHAGLVSEFDCYESCSNAWSSLVNGNLRAWITTGVASERSPAPR